ncbi:ComEA family DNA-binding protein [Neiella litorisoli]
MKKLIAVTIASAALWLSSPTLSNDIDTSSDYQQQLPAVNINHADAETIADRLSGIGLVKAQAIVDYRQQHGPFRSLEELTMVTGIGEALLDKNRAYLSL